MEVMEAIAALRTDPKYLTDTQKIKMRAELEQIRAILAAAADGGIRAGEDGQPDVTGQGDKAGKADKIGESEDFPNPNFCPVCVEAPRKVFCCVECDNWVCEAVRATCQLPELSGGVQGEAC